MTDRGGALIFTIEPATSAPVNVLGVTRFGSAKVLRPSSADDVRILPFGRPSEPPDTFKSTSTAAADLRFARLKWVLPPPSRTPTRLARG